MANSALALVADPSAFAIITATGLKREQVDLIKQTVAVGATDMELALLIQTAHHRGLDLLTRQMHFVKRKVSRQNPFTGAYEDVMVGTMQTGIDGFRLIADRTGKYDGQDDAEFEYVDSEKKTYPFLARVRVYKVGVGRPFVGTAHFSEYAQTKYGGELTMMWKNKPHIMLAKCAEALALRKAFPENLSGLYTDDEMPAIEGEAIVHETAAAPTGTARQMPPSNTRATATVVPDQAPAADIPPEGSDGPTLRAWIGKKLAFASKNWTGKEMALACSEVAAVLGRDPATVTPKTLAADLVAYRDALAAPGSDVADTIATDDGDVPIAEDEADGIDHIVEQPAAAEDVATLSASDAYATIEKILAERKMGEADARLQELVATASEADGDAVIYAWPRLKSAGLKKLVELLTAEVAS